MSAEIFFIDIVSSYRTLLSSYGKDVPCLRDYCRSRHVSWRDFMNWASSHPLASDLLDHHLGSKQKKRVIPASLSSSSGVPSTNKPLLHRLNILSNSEDASPLPAEKSVLLRDVCIMFPNGIKVSIVEATAKGVSTLVHSVQNLK